MRWFISHQEQTSVSNATGSDVCGSRSCDVLRWQVSAFSAVVIRSICELLSVVMAPCIIMQLQSGSMVWIGIRINAVNILATSFGLKLCESNGIYWLHGPPLNLYVTSCTTVNHSQLAQLCSNLCTLERSKGISTFFSSHVWLFALGVVQGVELVAPLTSPHE